VGFLPRRQARAAVRRKLFQGEIQALAGLRPVGLKTHGFAQPRSRFVKIALF
jgi:hypothetical protein